MTIASWHMLSPFVAGSTSMPLEALDGLLCPVSARCYQRLLVLRHSIEKQVSQIESVLATAVCEGFPYAAWKQWRKVWKQYDCSHIDNALLLACLDKASASHSLLEELQKQMKEWQRVMLEVQDSFDGEFHASRAAIWNNLEQSSWFLKLLNELNPGFVQQILPYTKRWTDESRNKDYRKRETTLVAYLARLCAKNSIAGLSGPMRVCQAEPGAPFALSHDSQHLSEPVQEVRAYLAYWAARGLTEKLKGQTEIMDCLPLHLNPACLIVDGCLVSPFSMPQIVQYLPDNRFLPMMVEPEVDESAIVALINLLQHKCKIVIAQDAKNEQEKVVWRQLFRQRFLCSPLDLPAEAADSVAYLTRQLTKLGLEDRPELQSIFSWHKVLKDLPTSLVQEQPGGHKQVESMLQDLLQDQELTPRSGYYADKYPIYYEARTGDRPMVVGQAALDPLLKDFSIALDLIVPHWLERVSVLQSYSEGIWAGLVTKDEVGLVDWVQTILKFKLAGQHKLSVLEAQLETMGKALSPSVLEIRQLQTESRDFLAHAVGSGKDAVVELDRYDVDIKSYRDKLARVIGQYHLPVFACTWFFQVLAAQEADLSQGPLHFVQEGVIFGNSLHSGCFSAFFDPEQTQVPAATHQVLRSLSQVKQAWADFPMRDGRQAKFTPWITPGMEIECFAPSQRAEAITFRDVYHLGPEEFLKRYHLPFPFDIRYQTKLIFDDFIEHCPRITWRQHVLQREAWKFTKEQLELPSEKHSSPRELLLWAQRLKLQYQLPDEIFVDPEGPKKPIFIHLSSPLLIELLANLARTSASLLVSECLPTTRQRVFREQWGSRCYGFAPFVYYQSSA